MNNLNETQCEKLDAILLAFGESDYLDGEKVLNIEPIERKANSLINELVARGFVVRTDVEEKDLPMFLTLDSSAIIFLENGGFTKELKTRKMKETNHPSSITINSTGHGNTINTGNHNNFQHRTEIFIGNLDHLKDQLRANKVDEADIAEIADIVTQETPADMQFGPRAKSWIKNMIGKSLDSTWEVGLSTAGGLLTEVISKYYGI